MLLCDVVCVHLCVSGGRGSKLRHLYLNNGTAVLLKVGRWVCRTDQCPDYTEALCSLLLPQHMVLFSLFHFTGFSKYPERNIS